MRPDSYDISMLAHDTLGSKANANSASVHWRFVWAHGWGQNRQAMAQLAQSLSSLGDHILPDFPGFGDAPPPQVGWSTADYAELMARFLDDQPNSGPTVWIGHSFGGRVGIQLAARRPDLVDRLVLIAAAGLQRRRSLLDRTRIAAKVRTFKTLKHLAPVTGMDVDKLRERFGSSDYRNAGDMRDTLTKVVSEDLSDVAARVGCPTRLIYGELDTETPPEIGKRLAALIPNSEISVLPGQDHYSVLGEGRHHVAKRIRDFLDR